MTSADPSPLHSARKPRGQGPSRRGEILAAAKRLFVEVGYEGATMRRIAAAVGVSSTALYVYFPDKEAILLAIAEAMFEDLLAALAASQDPALPPLARFRAGLRCYIAFGRSRPDEYRLTFLAKLIAAPAPGPARCRIEAGDQSFAILARSVAELMAAGTFRPGDPMLVTEAIWACLHGVTALVIDKADHLESDPDALVDMVIELATRGAAAVD